MSGGENLFSWRLLNKAGKRVFFLCSEAAQKKHSPQLIEKILPN
jgi:hypothetical protein